MKNIIKIISVLGLLNLLSGCVDYDESTYIVDDAGVRHHTVHYTKDKRGREHFPLQIPSTGQKEFVFDPTAYSWAMISVKMLANLAEQLQEHSMFIINMA
jgi:hypothetical protein